jgi:hypothetical protein
MLTLALVVSLVAAKLPALAAPKPAAKRGTIVIKTLTPGAKVFLDGKPAGTAPTTLKNVQAGEHKVKLKRIGYLMSEETVLVQAGKTNELQIDLLPYAGILTVKTQPKGAQVFVDGKGVGVVPYEGEISIGRRAVEVKKDGFQTYREVFQVGAGETYKIDIALKKGESEATADVPLVAVIPKKAKKKGDDDGAIDIPLEAPPSLNPRFNPLQVSAGAEVGPSDIWYKKWWVWTIAGAVVATSVGVGLGVGLSQVGGTRAADFIWEFNAR